MRPVRYYCSKCKITLSAFGDDSVGKQCPSCNSVLEAKTGTTRCKKCMVAVEDGVITCTSCAVGSP